MGSPNDVLDCDASAGRVCMCSTSGRDAHALYYLLLKLHGNVTDSTWTSVLVFVDPVGTRDREPFSKKQIHTKKVVLVTGVLAFVRLLQYVTHLPIKP